MSDFGRHFSTHVATSFARQLALGDYLDAHSWHADLGAGTVDFGDGRVFPIQLLGTESELDETWLWAWANTESNLPETLLGDCHRLRRLGEERRLPELTEATVPLATASGHMLAMLAVGLIGGGAYYRGPYDGGALFFLVKGLPAEVVAPVDGMRATSVLNEVISRFDLDHRRMARSFLTAQGFETIESGQSWTALRDDGEEIRIEFDDRNLIARCAARARPS